MNRQELDKHISETYGCEADHPFEKYPEIAVYRHRSNKKWFAALMKLSGARFGHPEDDALYILNLKCDPLLIGALLSEEGFHPAYHMNKTTWISADISRAEEDKIKWLIDLSFDLTNTQKKKRPAAR